MVRVAGGIQKQEQQEWGEDTGTSHTHIHKYEKFNQAPGKSWKMEGNQWKRNEK